MRERYKPAPEPNWRSHRDLWSGRWESNPAPNAAKSLNLLVHCGRLASNSVQPRSYFLDRFPVRVAYDMPVNL
jgi:hypothetical protein